MGFCLRSWRKKKNEGGKERTPLYLNVYDVTPANNYLYWFGLGIFHSSIEVHGKEYGFGFNVNPLRGVFEVEPRQCPGFKFRKAIPLGSTDMSHAEFLSFLRRIGSKYYGDTYHFLAKNCNHFTNEVSLHLTGRSIPGWVNRLARLGSCCNCLLPGYMQVDIAQQHND